MRQPFVMGGSAASSPYSGMERASGEAASAVLGAGGTGIASGYQLMTPPDMKTRMPAASAASTSGPNWQKGLAGIGQGLFGEGGLLEGGLFGRKEGGWKTPSRASEGFQMKVSLAPKAEGLAASIGKFNWGL